MMSASSFAATRLRAQCGTKPTACAVGCILAPLRGCECQQQAYFSEIVVSGGLNVRLVLLFVLPSAMPWDTVHLQRLLLRGYATRTLVMTQPAEDQVWS